MQQASQIVLRSKQCKESSKKYFPIDPNELFNQTWLKLREVEIKKPDWRPNNAVSYFLKMMFHEATAIRKQINKCVPYDENRNIINPEVDQRIKREEALLDWINSPSKDDDILFCKNIIILTIYSENINDACMNADIDRAAFYRYRKQAINKFYEDTNYSANLDIFHGVNLV